MRKTFAGMAGGAALCLFASIAQAHYMGDYPVGATVCRFFGTSQPTTGASFALAGSPTVEVYKDGSDTEDTDDSGVTLTASVDGVAGQNRICVDTSTDGTFYSAGAQFSVQLEAGTVDGVSVVGQPIMSFSLEKTAALRPATNGREVVIDTDGLAQVNLAEVLDTDVPTPNTAGVLPVDSIRWAGATTATDDIALLSQLAKTTHITGFNDITAASVWAVDATGQQTQGTFGQAIGDPGADTDSIWSLANTNLNATVGSRMPTFTLPTNFASMDINATGGVGIDWGNVQNPTTTVGLTGTTVDLVTGAVDDTAINSASELATAAQTGAGSALTSYDPPTRAELTADKAEIMSMIGQRTTITVTDQDTFTLAAGPDRDDAVRGWAVMLLETGNDGETDLVRVADYVGSSKTVELARAAGFTIATGDVAVLLPAFLDTPVDTALVNCTVNTANFAGSTTTLACILTDKDGGAVTAASGDLTGLELKITSGAQAYEGRFINSTTWDAVNSELQLTLSRALPATLADGVTAIIR